MSEPQSQNNMSFSSKTLEYNSFEQLNKIHNLNKKQSNDYTLLGYKKDTITDDLYDYRSLIFYNNKLLAYAPPKSISYELFKTSYPEHDENLELELFVEGTMIMLYYNSETTTWETSTRGNIGATTSFFQNKSKKTFRNMFDEACNMSFLDINILNKELCYIFVMNHPDNRIVTRCDIPELYLVKIYKIINNEDNTFDVQVLNNLNSIKEEIPNTLIKYPDQLMNQLNLSINDFKDESNNFHYEKLNAITKGFNYNIMGVVLYDKIRDIRTKIRNDRYEYVRKLRGNQPKLDYRYLELKKNKNINRYLQYYPEHKENFDEYWNKTKDFTNDLYNNYVETHITKNKQMSTVNKEFRPHIYNLHQYYLQDLRPNKYTLQKSHVISYVNNLPEAMLLYALNYKKNKVLNLSIEIPDVSSDSFDDVPAAPRSKSNDKHPIDESINTDIC
tara:strand:- start:384 stop:1718 length:1335 start_codon:yes stop_codon:yes gene_type:complete